MRVVGSSPSSRAALGHGSVVGVDVGSRRRASSRGAACVRGCRRGVRRRCRRAGRGGLGPAGQQQRVVLGVGVGAADQPVPGKRVGKAPDGPRRRQAASLCAAAARSAAAPGPPSFWYLRSGGGRGPGRGPPGAPRRIPPPPRRGHSGSTTIGRLVGEALDPGADRPARRAASRQRCSFRSWSSDPRRRLEDVGGGRRAGRHAPASVPKEQRGLGSGAGEAELAGERAAEPGRSGRRAAPAAARPPPRSVSQATPRAAPRAARLVRQREPHRSGAVLADRGGQQRERGGGGDVKLARPAGAAPRRCRAGGPTARA